MVIGIGIYTTLPEQGDMGGDFVMMKDFYGNGKIFVKKLDWEGEIWNLGTLIYEADLILFTGV